MRWMWFAFWVLCLPAGVWAVENDGPRAEPRAGDAAAGRMADDGLGYGAFRVGFSRRSELSDLQTMAKRLHVRADAE